MKAPLCSSWGFYSMAIMFLFSFLSPVLSLSSQHPLEDELCPSTIPLLLSSPAFSQPLSTHSAGDLYWHHQQGQSEKNQSDKSVRLS